MDLSLTQMTPRVLVLFQSWSGNTFHLAQAVVEGAAECTGRPAQLRRVPEIRPEAELLSDARIGTVFARICNVPLVSPADLDAADVIVFGCPTRMGSMSAEMKLFIDRLSGLWRAGAFADKIGAGFTSASTPHGGQEMTLLSLAVAMTHLGMILASPGYTATIFEDAGSPYGATATTKRQGVRHGPTAADLKAATAMGRRVANVGRHLLLGRRSEDLILSGGE